MHKFLIMSLLALCGCTSMMLGNGGSAGRPIGSESGASSSVASDRRITSTIRSRYAADEDLAAAGLSVETVNGVVTLRGEVSDYTHRDRAIRLARDVEGVLRVSVQIGIRR